MVAPSPRPRPKGHCSLQHRQADAKLGGAVNSSLHRLQCSTLRHLQRTVHSIACSVQYTPSPAVYSTLHRLQCSVHCTTCSVLHHLQCTVYFTACSVQYPEPPEVYCTTVAFHPPIHHNLILSMQFNALRATTSTVTLLPPPKSCQVFN